MLKKIFVVIISIVLLNCADASAFTCDFSEYTPTNALIRSAVMPGWGQGWNYQKTKGWIVFGVFAVSVFGAFYYLNKSEGDYERYKELGAIESSYYDDYEKDLNVSRIFGCVAVASWLFSIVDAYIVANKQSEEDYGYKKFNFYTYGKDGFMLSYKTRFSV